MKTLYIFFLAAFISSQAVAQQANFQNSNFNNTVGSQAALSNFVASEGQNGVQLSWTSAGENNVSNHEIQKSANGSSFTSIGSVIAKNDGNPYKYTYADATPIEGVNFYRIRTIDKQGNTTYSDIVKVDNGFRKTGITVLPNPVKGGVLNLQMSNFTKGKYAISLFSNAGQKVFARSLDFTDGSSTETIDLPQNITRGSYFLIVSDGVSNINTQVFVQ